MHVEYVDVYMYFKISVYSKYHTVFNFNICVYQFIYVYICKEILPDLNINEHVKWSQIEC